MPMVGSPPPSMPGLQVAMPSGGPLSLADACEAAGKGMKTGGSTVEDDEVKVFGPDEDPIKRPEVFKTFEEIKDFPRDIRDQLKRAGFPSPSQIQAYTWPLGLRNK